MAMRAVIRSLVLASALLGAALGASPAQAASLIPLGGRFSDCFWTIGAVNGGALNIAYPDAGANYWGAVYNLPPGATLTLSGRFPHSRYASLNAYNSVGAVQDALADFQINADRGAVNPFRPGALRTARRRSFHVRLADDLRPGALDPDQRTNEPARNVLHTAMPGDATHRAAVLWRVYVPDRGRDLRGGVPLPQPRLVLRDGRVLRGRAACAALGSQKPIAVDPAALLIPRAQYDAMRYQPGKPPWFPAQPVPVWRVQYSRAYLLALYTGESIPNPPKGGQSGFFPNLHNQYVRAALSRKLGRVFALRGKMATTPATFGGERRMKATQLRYQSFCMNESVLTTRVMDCVYDEQVPLSRGRRYVVVTSRSEDRPRNATRRCGVAWIRWSPRGDGGRDHDFGWMQIRNMLPSPSFHHAVQDTRRPGDERRVLGPYLPTGKYYRDKRAFERLGCPVR